MPLEGVVYANAAAAERFIRDGAWIDRRIDEQLGECCERYGDKTAFVCDDVTMTFAELGMRSDELARILVECGLLPGDRALFQMGTTIETVVSFFACLKAGVIPVCTIPQYRELEMHKLADITRPSAYFVQSGEGTFDLVQFAKDVAREKSIAHVIAFGRPSERQGHHITSYKKSDALTAVTGRLATSGQDVAVLQLSGGSTGVPKVIPRFHAEYLGHVRQWCDRYDMQPGDVGIWALPLMHNAGMMFALLRTVLYGCCTVLVPRWDPEQFLTLIERWKVNHAFTIGPHAPAIASFDGVSRFDLSTLRFFLTLQGAASIERTTGVATTNMFGITEGLVLTGHPDDPASVRHASVGAPSSAFDEIRLLQPGTEDEVADGEVGELCFRGPSSLRGYFAAPELSAECLTSDGFFRTADLMRRVQIDGRTAFVFEGRMRDNINRGGEKFGTEDIEHLIAQHPDVVDGKVVAMPDPTYGEKACAFIIPKPGRQLITLAEIARFLIAKGLAKFKLPERIEPIDSFPVTRVGKLDRAALRSIIASRLADETGQNEETVSRKEIK